VQHRHLLPNEIDLLLDEETGFGVQPLREHARGCVECARRVSEAKHVTDALSALPQLAPQIGLPDRVMAQVPVFVPWHVAAGDAVRQWTPGTPLARVAAAAIVAIAGVWVTTLTLWIATRGDMLAVLTGVVGEGARAAFSRVVGDLALAFFGPQVVDAVQLVGPLGAALAAAGFVIASLATVLGLRRIATSGHTRS
jgi:hypothetical protein